MTPGQPPGPQQAPPNPQLQQAQAQLQQIQKQLEQIQENKQVLQLLRDERTRCFRIDIETDSTIEPDEQAEKKSRIEFTEISGKFLGEALPILQVMPQAAPLFQEVFLFLVRGFRAGRQLEDVIERTMQAIGQAANQPKPNPEEMKLQMEQQSKAKELEFKQAESQQRQQEGQQKLQFEQQKHEQSMQFEREKHQNEMAMKGQEMQMRQAEGEQAAQQKQEEMSFQRESKGADIDIQRQDMAMRKQEGDASREFERDKASLPPREDVEAALERGNLARGLAMEDSLSGYIQEGQQATQQILQMLGAIRAEASELKQELTAPAEIIRGRDGRATGVRKGSRSMNIQRGADGRATGLQ